MAVAQQFPPVDGSMTVLPGFLDFQAKHNPSAPWVAFPSIRSPNTSTTVSFLEFSKATHRVAHYLRPNRVGQDGEVVAVVTNSDTILYLALIVGMARAGLVVCIATIIIRSIADNHPFSHSPYLLETLLRRSSV